MALLPCLQKPLCLFQFFFQPRHSGPSLQQCAALRIGNLPPDKRVAGWWWQGDVIYLPNLPFLYPVKKGWKSLNVYDFFFGKLSVWGGFKIIFWDIGNSPSNSFFDEFHLQGGNLLGSITACRLLTITRHSWCQWNRSRGSRWSDSYLASQTPTWHEPWNPKSWLVYDGILILAYDNPHIIGK